MINSNLELSNKWEIKKLVDVCEIVNGGTPRTDVKEYWNGKHAWVTPAEMGKKIDPYVEKTERALTDAGLKNSSAQLLPLYSVILSSRAPIGHLVINKKPMAFNQGCKGLIPNSKLYYKYLYYFLLGKINLLNSLGTGATFKELSSSKLKDVNISFPILPEQKRIVAILDEVFAAIVKARSNAEKNLANAREVFVSYLTSIFSSKGVGWEEKKLGEIATVFSGYSFKSKQFLKAGKYQVIRMGNVRPGIIRKNENPVFISEVDENILVRSLLKKQDIIITQTGTKKKRDYGYTAAIDDDNFLLNQRLAAIRFNDSFNYRFFLYFSWSERFLYQFFANETGTVGQGNVGIGAVLGANIPFPSVTEQNQIVATLDDLAIKTKRLEEIYEQKIADLDELKKSILQKAFEGEL